MKNTGKVLAFVLAAVLPIGSVSVSALAASYSEAVPPIYDYAEDFSEGLALVVIANKYGYIDKTGSEVIPVESNDAYSFSEGLALVRRGDHHDRFGNFIEGNYYYKVRQSTNEYYKNILLVPIKVGCYTPCFSAS